MNSTVTNNPVTAVAAVGQVIAGVGYVAGWDDGVQLAILQTTLGVAFLVRAGVAWLDARRARHQAAG